MQPWNEPATSQSENIVNKPTTGNCYVDNER